MKKIDLIFFDEKNKSILGRKFYNNYVHIYSTYESVINYYKNSLVFNYSKVVNNKIVLMAFEAR